MDDNRITSSDLLNMIKSGAASLANDEDRINALNVFPVPDGDTGSNMRMTIEGGSKTQLNDGDPIGAFAKLASRQMVLSARGNSGVILSQFFKGLSIGMEGKETVDVRGFAEAMVAGTKKSYSVVSKPTEGTILTVMREAGEYAYAQLSETTTLDQYFTNYLKEANASLGRTPDLLPVLKKAGVIDSGGAGFVRVIEGMHKAAIGQDVHKGDAPEDNTSAVKHSAFNADSELTYGYCTEFILQLQNSKVDIPTFDVNTVLTEMRKYGEFVTVKIENMNVQHSENEEFFQDMPIDETDVPKREHKKYALVAVANGTGLVKQFKDMGVDEVVTGGQTMNTSTQDFIDAFNKLDAEYILVFPNNGNIKMAAQMAADNYTDAKVIVVPTKTIAEGYSAISMLNLDSDDIDQIMEEEKEAIANVSTLEVTYSIRDCVINDINVKKGSFICLYNDELISCDEDRVTAVCEAFKKIPDIEDKQVITILCGQDVTIDECQKIQDFVMSINSYIESYPVQGDQDIYSYIIGIE